MSSIAAKAQEFVGKFVRNIPALDTGGRGATTTFAQRGIGDVLLTFENEVPLTIQEFGDDQFEIVVPSLSVRANNPVALADKFAAKNGNTALAQAYLQFQFSDAAQEIYARNNIRPSNEKILQKYAGRFPSLNLFTVEAAFGGWDNAQKVHFADGGTYDQITR